MKPHIAFDLIWVYYCKITS